MGKHRSDEWATWRDVEHHMPWLTPEPYLLQTADLERTLRGLEELGFRVIHARAPEGADLEHDLLVELTHRLDFSPLGAGSWAAFNDRLWDVLSESWEPPIAVVIEDADRLLRANLRTFVRCVHNLVSMTEAVGLANKRAQRQFLYFFTGNW